VFRSLERHLRRKSVAKVPSGRLPAKKFEHFSGRGKFMIETRFKFAVLGAS
jgi:hypothetical protein